MCSAFFVPEIVQGISPRMLKETTSSVLWCLMLCYWMPISDSEAWSLEMGDKGKFVSAGESFFSFVHPLGRGDAKCIVCKKTLISDVINSSAQVFIRCILKPEVIMFLTF